MSFVTQGGEQFYRDSFGMACRRAEAAEARVRELEAALAGMLELAEERVMMRVNVYPAELLKITAAKAALGKRS